MWVHAAVDCASLVLIVQQQVEAIVHKADVLDPGDPYRDACE